MEYTLLSSLFYQDKTTYEQTYQNRINSESTYKLDFTINEFPAFVMITHEILENVQKIFELNSELNMIEDKHLPKLAIDQYTKKCLVDEIKKTNDIESVYSTKKEIKRILNSPNTTKKNRFWGLVIKYQKIINGEKISLKTCSDIRTLYNEFALNDVLADNPDNMPDGELFRTESVLVRGSGKIIHEGMHPESKIIESLSSSLNFLNDENYNFFIRIAVFHYMFGYIHPFYDGNGRMSRFISSYLLSQKLNKLVSLRLSYTIKNKQGSYYKMFKVSNDEKNKGDLTYFVIRFLELIIESIEDLISALSFKSVKLAYYQDICKKSFGTNKKLVILTFVFVQNELFDDDPLDFKSLNYILNSSDNFKIGESTLRDLLKQLENQDILIVDKTHGKYTYRIDLDKLENL